MIVLNGDLTIADVIHALRKSGLAVSDGYVRNVYALSRIPDRFPDYKNVIDLTVEQPAFLRRQAGPIRDIPGIDFTSGPFDAA